MLVGFSASNSIYGWFGVDTMTGLGGNDIFIFRSIFDSGNSSGQRDTITDFFTVHGDQLDFTGIDADSNSGNGDTAFSFIGTAAFTAIGQIRYYFEGGSTVVEINTTGDINSEMEIILTNGNSGARGHGFHAVGGNAARQLG